MCILKSVVIIPRAEKLSLNNKFTKDFDPKSYLSSHADRSK